MASATANPTFILDDDDDVNTGQMSNGNGVSAPNGKSNGSISSNGSIHIHNSNQLDPNLQIQISEDNRDHLCGYGSCTPTWLQRFNNPKMLLLSLSMCTIIQGFVINGLVPVSITTLERRFHLNSAESGLFSSFYDVAVMLVVVPVCYYGNKGHKGRWCALGVFMMGFGSLLCALPQFTTGPYQTNSSLSWICSLTANSPEDCSSASSNLRLYLYVLLAGQVLHGVGASPLYTLGVTYIDENVSQKASPMYLGIFLASGTVGPALGFIAGGMLLRIYGDVGKVDEASLGLSGPEDPRWYGAWWIGFLLSGVAAILASFPLLSFGRELPQAQKHRLKDIDQTNQHPSSVNVNTEELNDSLKNLPRHCLNLLRNPTFSCMIVMQCADAFLLNGFITFVPKLMENLFTLSSSKASLITGAIVVPFGLAGNIIGGFVIRRFDLKCAKIILLALCSQMVCLGLVFIFFIRCPEAPLAGANVGYLSETGSSFSINVTHTCNSNCGCTSFYNPVCSPDTDTSFYSPCHAGCATESVVDGIKQWSQCTCISPSVDPSRKQPAPLVEGVCKVACGSMPAFLVLFAVLVLFTFIAVIPVQQTVLRSVKFSQRSLAMGLQWIFIRLLGSIPGAIFFGMAIDKTCILWKRACGMVLSCLRYEGANLALVILGYGVCLKVICIVSLFFAWKLYQAPATASQSHAVLRNNQSSDLTTKFTKNGNLHKIAPVN